MKKSLQELLGEELFKQVEDKAGKGNVDIVQGDNAKGVWIPKETYDADKTTLKTEVDGLKDQVKTMDGQLEELKKIDADGLKSKIEELQTENKRIEKESTATLRNERLKFAALTEFSGAGLKEGYSDMMLSRVDFDKVILSDDGAITGLSEQVEGFSKSFPDVFGGKTVESQGTDTKPKKNPTAGKNPFKKDSFSLTAQGELFKSDPNLYEKLKGEAEGE